MRWKTFGGGVRWTRGRRRVRDRKEWGDSEGRGPCEAPRSGGRKSFVEFHQGDRGSAFDQKGMSRPDNSLGGKKLRTNNFPKYSRKITSKRKTTKTGVSIKGRFDAEKKKSSKFSSLVS